MSKPASAWLEEWRATAPPSLVTTAEQALAETAGDADDAAALAAAAVVCLRAALRTGDDRGAALHLLAADALITAALQAAAGSERELEELVTRFSAESLGALFRDELSAERS